MKRIGEKITAWKGPSDHKALITNKPSNLRFAPRTVSRSGLPEAADALAYEPVQRLLAVGTSDGHVKVIGQYGIECVIASSSTDGTKCLSFLPNAGSLLRVTQSGIVELIDLDLQKVVTIVEMNDDSVECVALIPGQPYIMLGCVSGILRVCCMADVNLDPITQARPVMNLRLLNYRVSKHMLGVSGRMTSLSVCLSTCGPLALMIHESTGLLIWNVRFSRPVCALPNQSLDVLVSVKITDPGEVTCATWIGKLTSPYLFATGHECGNVFTWSMPNELRGVNDRKQLQVPRIMHQFIIRPDRSTGNRVESISFISGSEDGLLVFGGQALEEPAGLSLFDLRGDPDEEASEHVPLTGQRTSLAWFGTILDYVLAPPKGSMEHFDDPAGVIVLSESGNLVLYDLQSLEPIPFSMPFQLCQKLCSASLFMKPRASSELKSFLTSIGEQSDRLMEEIGGVCDHAYKWVLSGAKGELSEPDLSERDCPLLILGYEDGTVRFWSVQSRAPVCLYAIERNELSNMAAVKTIEVLDEGMFLIVGDEKGRVFVFQLSTIERTVKIRRFRDADGTAETEEASQRPGYQLCLVLSLNSGAIRKIAFHAESWLLAALDDSGGMCIMNLVTLEPIFVDHSATRSPRSVVDITFCETPVIRREDETSSEVYLFMTDDVSNTVALDPASGTIVKESDWLHPKNESKTVRLLSVDSAGLVPSIANAALGGTDALFWTSGEPVIRENAVERKASDEEQPEELHRDDSELAGVCTEPKREENEDGPVEETTPDRTDKEQEGNVHHERFASDDAETNALLAAAVAKIDESPSESKTKTRTGLGLSNWKKKNVEGSPTRIHNALDSSPTVASTSWSGGPFLLLITETYIRLYAPHSVVACVRAPLHKISFPGQIAWATPVSHTMPGDQGEEGGLLVLAYDGSLTLFALPSLETVGSSNIDDIVEFPLYKDATKDEGSLANLKLFEGNGAGGAYLCSRNGELIQIDCLQQEESTSGDAGSSTRRLVYDWELAHAAHSASHLTQAGAINANISVVGEQPSPATTIRRGVDFFVSLGRRARDELDKAIRSPGKGKDGSAAASASSTTDTYEPPELDILFCANDHKPPPEIRAKHVRHASFQDPTLCISQSHVRSSANSLIPRVRGVSNKEVDISDVIGPSSPRQRTAAEVREKYGRQRSTYRSANSTAEDVGSIMSENVSKLHDRGERLRTLNDKTEDLVNDAQSFAEMAKQLAQQKSRKWWQL